jgi:hypothetical protein
VIRRKFDKETEAEKRGRQSGKYKKISTTGPDATMSITARNRRLEHCDKQHTAVDDKRGVMLDVEVTTGEKNEGEMIEPAFEIKGLMLPDSLRFYRRARRRM